MAPDGVDIVHVNDFVALEGAEISAKTVHSLGDELSADVDSCSCCSVLGGVGKNYMYKLVKAFSCPEKQPV